MSTTDMKTLTIGGTTYTIHDETARKAVDSIPDWAKAETKPSYTASEVGAAPAGFGLGATFGKDVSSTDFNTITANGWYYFNYGGPNMPDPTLGYSYMFVCAREGGVTQYIFQSNFAANAGCVHKRTMFNGVWDEWEWVNPPMQLGVEYRTTERYMGNPVYTKLVAFTMEAISGSGTIMIPHDIANFDFCVDVKGRPYTVYVLPYVNGTESTAVNAVDATNIHLTYTNAKWSAATWRFKLSYTKTV